MASRAPSARTDNRSLVCQRRVEYSLVVNRMSPSAWMRGHRDAIFHTLRYLEHLEDLGAPVLNGARAFRFELSKAAAHAGTFNLCPADYCELPGMAVGVSGRGLPVEAYEPPTEIVEEARGLVAAAGMDVAGVEYLVDARDGGHVFYDVNALSNFVADAPNVVGFNPYNNLAALIIERAIGLPAASAA